MEMENTSAVLSCSPCTVREKGFRLVDLQIPKAGVK